MIAVQKRYQSPSTLDDQGAHNTLGLSVNAWRPVRFHARVARHVHPFRIALQALGELVWTNDQHLDDQAYQLHLERVLDPVVTVHEDRVFFEAFSQDQSCYGLVIAEREIFEPKVEPGPPGQAPVGLRGQTFLFTGTLASMKRRDAQKRVQNAGGGTPSSVRDSLDFLVIGDGDLQKFQEGWRPSKLKKAEQLIAQGSSLRVIGETEFLSILQTAERPPRVSPVQTGTTNIDFTEGLYQALDGMLSSRETWLNIGPEGVGVTTQGGGDHFEAKVELPQSWVRGFLQIQGAMCLPGTRLIARPVDLLNVIRYERTHKSMRSPRSLRYEMEPGQEARVVLEPWNKLVHLRGAEHRYQKLKITRTWGRRRLRLLEGLLPHAQSVQIYLKGRALPSFYAVQLPGVTFVLGLSGWLANHWTQSSSFDLLAAPGVDPEIRERVLTWMRTHLVGDEKEMARDLGIESGQAFNAAQELARLGMVIYDVQARQFRHRELFSEPIDPEDFYPPDPRRIAAGKLVAAGRVTLVDDVERETSKPSADGRAPRVFTDRVLNGFVGEDSDPMLVHLVLRASGQIIFGTCSCPFFVENLMNLGPCEHMLGSTPRARSSYRSRA